MIQIVDMKKRLMTKLIYVNVFALSRGPGRLKEPSKKPSWRIKLSNNNGEERMWYFIDSDKYLPGWHNFLIRWDHEQPILEFLIDGVPEFKTHDYKKFWPNKYEDQILLGTWGNRLNLHFVETYLWRAILSTVFLNDAWVNRELAISRPKSPYSSL